MKKIQYFFECYFNQSFDFDDLDGLIEEYKEIENPEFQLQLITELHQIITTKNYSLATRLINKYGNRTFSTEKTEKFIKFLYDRLIDRPTHVQAKDFEKKFKGVFCPTCCPNPKKAKIFSLIEKATITKTGQHIFICKPCKLAWLSEDIRADNAHPYQEFMQLLGLEGQWHELSDVDLL